MQQLITQAEKMLQTDVRYFARNGFWVSASYIINIAGGMILAVWLANTLSKEAFGVYQFFLATIGILSAFTLSGMGTAVMQATAQGTLTTITSSFWTKLRWSIGISAAAIAAGTYYSLAGNSEYATAFLVIAVALPFTESLSLYQPFLSGREQFARVAHYSFWRKLIPVLATGGSTFLSTNPLFVVSVYVVSQLLIMVFLYTLTVQKTPPSLDANEAAPFRYGLHLSFMTVLGRLAQYADIILLYALLGPNVVAVYAIAKLPVQYTGGALKSLRSLFLPKLAKRDYNTLQRTLTRKVFFAFIISAALCALYIAAAPLLFKLLFPDFTEAILYTQVLALTMLGLPRAIYSQALTAHKHVRELYILKVVPPLVHLSAMVVLISLFDIWGAVAALLVFEVVTAIMTHHLFVRSRVATNVNMDSTTS